MSETNPLSDFAPGLHRFSQMERVYWGQSARVAIAAELEILRANRVFIISNRSFSKSAALNEIIDALGDRYVGMFTGVTAHSPRPCVLEGAQAARAARADLLLAIGGGSVIDASKAMLLCLRHGYTDVAQLEPHAGVRHADLGHAPPDASEWVRMLAVPTTLSGAEFSASAGLTDPGRGMKHPFSHPMQMPQAVILDPALTLDTPLAMIKSTGMKAIDHAAERMTSANANPYSDAVSELALRLLYAGLIELDERPNDLQLRSKLQYGMFMSLCGSASGVAVNVSHALGHVLGAHAGVPHGDTTGLVLPAVLRWNRDATAGAQAAIARALGRNDGDAAAAVSALVQRLGLPLRLRDANVRQQDLPEIARKTLHEPLLRNSRKPVTDAGTVETILESAW